MSEANQITVDVDGVAFQFDSGSSFESISNQVKQQFAPERVVTEVLLDDRYVDLEEEEGISKRDASALGKISFRTKEVSGLLRESLKLAPRVCEALLLEVNDIDQFFESNQVQAAHERIGELSALVDWLLQSIAGLQSYGTDEFRAISVEGSTVVDSVKRMEQLLSTLHTRLQATDFDGFREVLKGGFTEELKIWAQLFDKANEEWAPRALN